MCCLFDRPAPVAPSMNAMLWTSASRTSIRRSLGIASVVKLGDHAACSVCSYLGESGPLIRVRCAFVYYVPWTSLHAPCKPLGDPVPPFAQRQSSSPKIVRIGQRAAVAALSVPGLAQCRLADRGRASSAGDAYSDAARIAAPHHSVPRDLLACRDAVLAAPAAQRPGRAPSHMSPAFAPAGQQ